MELIKGLLRTFLIALNFVVIILLFVALFTVMGMSLFWQGVTLLAMYLVFNWLF